MTDPTPVPRMRVRPVLRTRPSGRAAGWRPALVVGLLVVSLLTLAPSRPAGRDTASTDRGGEVPVEVGPGGGSESGQPGPPTIDGADGTVPGTTPGATVAPGAPDGGDRSHCTPDGRQHGVTFHAPPCVGRFTGDNGGATATGVSATTVRVVAFMLRCDPLTDSLLTGIGFEITTCEQQDALMQTAVRFLNERLELYGRQIALEVRRADCPFPEDLDACLADARAVIAQRPFAVVTTFAGTYQAVWEEFVRSGTVLVGGGSLAESSYLRHSPYWWSLEMSSTLQARIVADWWCSTMAGRPADHSGAVIHPSVGRRGQVVRRAGFLYYDAPAGREAARILGDALAACGTQLTSFGYSADLATLQQQALALTSRFIADGVTTVMWFDYLAPTFVLPELTRQDYFPEHVGAGGSGSVADSSHRALDPKQWRHSVSLFPQGVGVPREQTEAAAVVRAAGWQGPIPAHAGSYIDQLLLLGDLLQAAGPRLTPDALRAIERLPRVGGDGSGDATGPREGIGFGPGDHNGVDDVREVWFDPDATSPIDGQRGAVRNVDGGARRTVGGRWAGPAGVPVAAG